MNVVEVDLRGLRFVLVRGVFGRHVFMFVWVGPARLRQQAYENSTTTSSMVVSTCSSVTKTSAHGPLIPRPN